MATDIAYVYLREYYENSMHYAKKENTECYARIRTFASPVTAGLIPMPVTFFDSEYTE